jgi:nitroimidazol reductase NimA-like FMN-containing flavoprotein (pyridoxamine 5'-phosphate oxidase superfamily)
MEPLWEQNFNMQTRIIQHSERSVVEEAQNILLAGQVAHVGFCLDQQPYVIPVSYHYDAEHPKSIYIHGGKTSRLMNVLCSGAPVCVEVTILDGLVYSRTAKYHSMNYRSAICFGRGRNIESLEEKSEILRHAVERYFPGRTEGQDYEKAPVEHLTATILAEVLIETWSAKARTGGPKGPTDDDPMAQGTAGVLSVVVAS